MIVQIVVVVVVNDEIECSSELEFSHHINIFACATCYFNQIWILDQPVVKIYKVAQFENSATIRIEEDFVLGNAVNIADAVVCPAMCAIMDKSEPVHHCVQIISDARVLTVEVIEVIQWLLIFRLISEVP